MSHDNSGAEAPWSEVGLRVFDPPADLAERLTAAAERESWTSRAGNGVLSVDLGSAGDDPATVLGAAVTVLAGEVDAFDDADLFVGLFSPDTRETSSFPFPADLLSRCADLNLQFVLDAYPPATDEAPERANSTKWLRLSAESDTAAAVEEIEDHTSESTSELIADRLRELAATDGPRETAVLEIASNGQFGAVLRVDTLRTLAARFATFTVRLVPPPTE
ncbi:hypothetical protein [Actinokineospora inagensis]|uniref:hypothetical protein n=1 Tax=Actinokineospora inagensis TaxID=103730 RepID=UPI000411CE21|nr:hypothetical protein [Actinokineospora inagensis]